MAATRLLMGLSSRSIASVDESITLPQFRLLSTLNAQGPLKLSGLADYLDVTSSTATGMINQLIGSDLVSGQVNPNSHREIVVELTRTGTNQSARSTNVGVPRSPALWPACHPPPATT